MIPVNRTKSAVLAVALLGAALASGCAPPELPELLPVATDSFLPAVQQQIKDATEAVEKRPGSAAANGELGMILAAYRQHTAAARCFERARLLDDDEFEWAYYHAVVLSLGGEPDAAMQAFRHALQVRPRDVMARVRLAGLLLASGSYDESGRLLDEALKAKPGHPLALLTRGQLLLRQGENEAALRALNRARAAAPNDPAVYFALAEGHRRQGQVDEAEANFARYQRLGTGPQQLSDPLMKRLYGKDATDAPLVARARRLYAAGRLDQAVQLLDEALLRNPDSLQAHVALIGISSQQGDFAKADQHYEAAYALDPNLSRLHFTLGVARLREDRQVEARQAFERALELDPADTAVLAQLGALAERKGASAEAIRHYRRALAIDAGFGPAREPLAGLLLARGEAAETVTLLTAALQASIVQPPGELLLLGNAYTQLGDLAAARQALHAGRKAAAAAGNEGMVLRIQKALAALETGP